MPSSRTASSLLVVLSLLTIFCLLPSFCLSAQVFALSDLSTDSDQAIKRISKWKNSGQLELIPRPPATLVRVSPQFWRKLSINAKAGIIRDCLYFSRYYNEHFATGDNNSSFILFNRNDPADELGWGNLKPGQIVIFK